MTKLTGYFAAASLLIATVSADLKASAEQAINQDFVSTYLERACVEFAAITDGVEYFNWLDFLSLVHYGELSAVDIRDCKTPLANFIQGTLDGDVSPEVSNRVRSSLLSEVSEIGRAVDGQFGRTFQAYTAVVYLVVVYMDCDGHFACFNEVMNRDEFDRIMCLESGDNTAAETFTFFLFHQGSDYRIFFAYLASNCRLRSEWYVGSGHSQMFAHLQDMIELLSWEEE